MYVGPQLSSRHRWSRVSRRAVCVSRPARRSIRGCRRMLALRIGENCYCKSRIGLAIISREREREEYLRIQRVRGNSDRESKKRPDVLAAETAPRSRPRGLISVSPSSVLGFRDRSCMCMRRRIVIDRIRRLRRKLRGNLSVSRFSCDLESFLSENGFVRRNISEPHRERSAVCM